MIYNVEEVRAAVSVMNVENYVDPEDPLVMSEFSEKKTPEKLVLWKEKMDSMNEEAQQVASIIFNAPKELLDLIPDSRYWISERKLQVYLMGIGWKRNKVLRAYSGIRKMLREK